MEKFYYEDSRSIFVQITAVSVVETDDGNTKEEYGYTYTGVILFCRSDFAYIIAHNACIKESTSLIRVEVDFPGNTSILVAIENVEQFEHFIVIGCVPENRFDINCVKAVQFDEKKLVCGESIHTICWLDYSRPPDMTSGRVSRAEDLFFYHSCRAGDGTEFGSPVFNDNAQFVGLCYGIPCGILAASNVSSIAKNLASLYRTDEMGIHEILLHIYAMYMPKDGEDTA